jgi:RNA polymerase sigma-70 factor (ECF subfamily)
VNNGQAIGMGLARGDGAALEEAYRTYATAVLAYLTRFVGPSEAEDVLQRTFLDAWRFAERYDTRERFSGWLFTIARRRAIDALRARRHDLVDVEQAREVVGEDGRETVDRLADAAELRAAVVRLPAHERGVIELTYFDGLSQQEIADRLQVPVGTVKARASRGTKRLRVLLRPGPGSRPGAEPRRMPRQRGTLVAQMEPSPQDLGPVRDKKPAE